MYNSFNPENHYWLRGNKTVYSSMAKADLSEDNAMYQSWLAAGNVATVYPKDEQGRESAIELQAVLAAYGLRAYLPTLEEAKIKKLKAIIEETESAILAGFDYDVDGHMLHFSYQYNDQQNFSDTANMATFAKMSVPGVPDSVTWNGWLVEKDGEGSEVDRSLVPVNLSNDEFLALYMQGALTHKAKQMAMGSERKAKVEAATTIEELEAV